jgi:O6-methylguanine-DNA--protein-cysteine methyltransferase
MTFDPGRRDQCAQFDPGRRACLGITPFTIEVPCHHVVATGRRGGDFSAPCGIELKTRMFRIERADVGR